MHDDDDINSFQREHFDLNGIGSVRVTFRMHNTEEPEFESEVNSTVL